jgi:hypothetical protein
VPQIRRHALQLTAKARSLARQRCPLSGRTLVLAHTSTHPVYQSFTAQCVSHCAGADAPPPASQPPRQPPRPVIQARFLFDKDTASTAKAPAQGAPPRGGPSADGAAPSAAAGEAARPQQGGDRGAAGATAPAPADYLRGAWQLGELPEDLQPHFRKVERCAPRALPCPRLCWRGQCVHRCSAWCVPRTGAPSCKRSTDRPCVLLP